MIELLSRKIAEYYVKKGAIEEKYVDAYAYGFELIVATLVNLVLIILVGVLTQSLLTVMFFSIGFIVLRTLAGGYHASSHLGCLLMLLINYGIVYVIGRLLYSGYRIWTSLFLLGICMILVFIFSPVEDENNPFSEEKKQKLRIRSRVSVILLTVGTICLLYFIKNNLYGLAVAFGMASVAISLVGGHLKNRLRTP